MFKRKFFILAGKCKFNTQQIIRKLTMKNTLITTNIITAVLLIGILVIEKYPQRICKRVNLIFAIQKPQYSFIDNPNYVELTDLYTVYSGQKDIVMLGNSLTNRINWNELLDRPDIANRGICSDITAGFINRINFVLNVKPKICFIEGGVNDLSHNINNEIIIKNLNTILDTLQINNVKPVLTTVTLVAKTCRDAKNFNLKIKKLNTQIIKLAISKKIDLIDLNPQLTDGDFLRSENAIADGIHFTSKAYKIWREKIMKIIEQEKI
jgi:lysophospholipase L1-like esterase